MGLKKPGESDYYNVADQNGNMDRLEAAIEERLEKTSLATAASNGVMAAADKAKLDGIEAGANNYVHPGSGTNPHGTTKADVGLGNVDNTADANKSVKYAATASYATNASSAATAAQVANENFHTNYHQVYCTNGQELYVNVDGAGPTHVGNTTGATVLQGSTVTLGNRVFGAPTLHYYMPLHMTGYDSQRWGVLEWFNEPELPLRHILRATSRTLAGTEQFSSPSADEKAILGSDTYRWNTVFAGAVDTPSDRKKKENIEEIEQAKAFILALRPRQFTYKDGDSAGRRRHMGFIAQDVAGAIRELDMPDMSLVQASVIRRLTDPEEIEAHGGESVIEGYYDDAAAEEDLSWNLNYMEFIAPMVAVMQEQERRIAALEERIAAMEDGQAAMKGGGETE